MHKLKFIILVFVVLSAPLAGKPLPVPDIPVKVFKHIENGNVESLSEYFSESIELILLDKEGIYSKAQASQILKKFFHGNRPKSFNVLHKGGSENAKYAIGTLTTSHGKYRIHFLIKIKNDQALIHQLRIQEEE